jgi:Extended Signal Peptide of Type V secretion system
MNKNRHRIIFNARCGQRMAVSESATSNSKYASGNSSVRRHCSTDFKTIVMH